ncbi:hypothetical protein HX116_09960 [Acinetobacter towneri]|uniref:hypothetical protein n=1 Tax=Acinetobacter towneri TaxID=202956 RepID=UPI0025774595|nr:hypothetical protein [Acinetobacter towneri]MDM1731474.1 hypothetical protein [Acinetobacter towneri]MDM1734137.1 hypothetical protein [Acinetobacter towneri]MDM1739340.1 hypothetical protein [Acinetobacter towneri]MDM1742132.1 hypothetical protein [Acinetobacter towneri]MDM1744737.1 hypothetical protein [Acinetobacter towneri]
MSTFQVFNDDLILQVDSDYNNFRLLRSLRIIGAYNSPKTFVCEPNMLYAVAPYGLGKNVAVTPKFVSVNGVMREAYNVYGDAIFYEFTHEKRQPSLHAVGFEMYDAQGQVILSSEDIMLRVIEYVYGNLTGVSVGSIIDDNAKRYFAGDGKPTIAYVLGVVPRKYTGGQWYNMYPGSPYLTKFGVFYEVSTLFFHRQYVDSLNERTHVTFDRFYYNTEYTRTYTSTQSDQINNIPINNSTNTYSILKIDLLAHFSILPEPILVP